MANITNELSNIKNAVLGKDVRSSIHDGIYAINKEVESTTQKQSDLNDKQDALNQQFKNLIINAGNSNAEVAASRGDYDYLPDRLNGFDEQFNTINSEMAYNNSKTKGNNKKAMITFVSDDGQVQDYTVLKDIFDKYKVPCVTAISGSRVGSSQHYATKQQLLELQNNYGWEICSHSYSHTHLSELTDEELEKEVRLNYEYLTDNGFKGSKIMCIPYGFYNDKVKKVVAKYHNLSRVSDNGFNEFPIESFMMKSNWITQDAVIDDVTGLARNSIEHFKKLIDMAVEKKCWLVIATHSWEIESWGSQTLLSNIIEYAKTKAEIVTFSQGLDYYKNSVEQVTFNKKNIYDNRFVIGQDGTVNSNVARTKVVAPLTFDYNSKPSQFDKDFITYTPVTGSQAVNFPESKTGLLITTNFTINNTNEFGFGYQEYHIYGENKYYRRNANADDTWGTWGKVDVNSNLISVKVDNTKLDTTPLSDFESNTITYTQVSTSSATNLPNKIGGLLTTYKFSYDTNTYSYQTWKAINSNDIYTRKIVDGSWGVWELEKIIVIENLNKYNGLTKPSGYPVKCVIHTPVNNSEANKGGLPITTGGVLTTYRFGQSDLGYNYQTYKQYASYNMWIRSQTTDTDEWQAWHQITIV